MRFLHTTRMYWPVPFPKRFIGRTWWTNKFHKIHPFSSTRKEIGINIEWMSRRVGVEQCAVSSVSPRIDWGYILVEGGWPVYDSSRKLSDARAHPKSSFMYALFCVVPWYFVDVRWYLIYCHRCVYMFIVCHWQLFMFTNYPSHQPNS